MNKKLRVHCPCGYVFAMFGEEEEAISLIQAHFDLFHKDFLPFGITRYEASTLVEKEFAHKKRKVLKRTFSSSGQNGGSALKKSLLARL